MVKVKKIDYESLLIYLMLFYPVIAIITTFTQKTTALSEISITQYAGVILVISYYLILKKKLFLQSLLTPFILLYAINIITSSEPWISIRDIMPINLVINLSILFFSGKFKLIKLNNILKKIIFTITLIGFYVFLIGIDIINEQYIGSYHAGLFGFPHRAAYYLLVIFIYTSTIDKKVNIFYILSLIGVLLTGVRTATIAMIIFLIFDIYSKIKYSEKENKKQLIKIGTIIIATILVSIIIKPIIFESIIGRFQELGDFNNIEDYGSGRISISEFILADIFRRNTANLFLGKPVIEEYMASEQYFGTPLWAHNDFLMILYVLGILGFLIYINYIIYRPMKYILAKKRKNTTLIHSAAILTCIIVMAILNGFYSYFMAHILIYLIMFLNTRITKEINKKETHTK